MRSRILVALVALAGLLTATTVARSAPLDGWAAQHMTPVPHAGPLAEHYSALWHACDNRASCEPGRNIRRDGVKMKHGTRPAHRVDYRASSATLDRWLHPPAARSTSTTSSQLLTSVASTSTPAVSGGMPSCTWRPESGGSYTAVNPSSGAYGKYQIIPSTWAAHCSGVSKDPAGQETCARRVMAAQGSGAWVNC